MDRVEHYLQRILNSPGYWIRISKRKGHHLSKNNKFKERQQVIQQVATALNLMGIKYEQLNGTKFRIPAPKVEKIDPQFPVFMGIDYAALEERILSDMINKGSSTYRIMYPTGRMLGKKPIVTIIDDIMENPCAGKISTPST